MISAGRATITPSPTDRSSMIGSIRRNRRPSVAFIVLSGAAMTVDYAALAMTALIASASSDSTSSSSSAIARTALRFLAMTCRAVS